MKVPVTFKDPDGVFDAIRDAIRADLASLTGLTEDERDSLVEDRAEKVSEDLSRWITYDEYLHVIFDTEEKTATVVVKS